MGRREVRESGWFVTALGVLVLVSTGFGLGLVVGIVSQEPELVVGHLAGESQEVQLADSRPFVDPELLFAAPREAEAPTPPAPPSTPPPVAAAPPAVSAPAPGAPGTAGFSVQVGAFEEGGKARSLASALDAKGFPTYVTPAATSGDGRWRVRVGPVPSRAEADSLASRLKRQERLPTWVLEESGG